MREVAVAPLVAAPETGGLADLVYANAEQAPDHIAFRRKSTDGWSPVTTREFRDQVQRLARGLVAAGVQPGERVAVLSATRYEWTLFDFAIWAAAAVPVPIYPTSSREQIEWIIADSGATAVVVETDEHAAKVAGLPLLRGVWRIDAVEDLVALGDDVPVTDVDERRRAVSPKDVATIIYTSGTTGRPKGCVLTHANFFAEADNVAEVLSPLFKGKDVSTLVFLPLAHVFGRMVQVGAVLARVTLGHTADVKNVVNDLATFRPTFVLSVPYVFEKIYNSARQRAETAGKARIFDAATETAIKYSEADKPGLALRIRHAVFDRLVYRRLRAVLGGQCRYAISGGAALGHRLTHFYRGIGLTVFEGYGLTETTAAATVNAPNAAKPGTVGRPVPGTAVRISDEGEVLIKGGVVFSGYWGSAPAADEWFATGDLGSLDEDGFLSITGRKKEILVTSGGKNVAPAVIEDRITAHPLVGQAVVVGDGRKFVAALITIDQEHLAHWKKSNGKPDEASAADLSDDEDLLAEIQRAVDAGNAAVSAAEAVRRFRVLPDEFSIGGGHLTPSLKLRRSQIMKDFADEVEALYGPR
ncbi:AMP-dependent synthetase/ligase [Allokutzneria albata]|uniref:Long-chain acyl-CoA synthetase n=1 Tax=Allokutzneria albata TaxID=211114 RepID=A0A1G9Y0B1_ALLAB|nr:AMP-dependent synthetase/ligase [Allokutzneria albata]SDN02166.1 long-chain acyl-CoA synthetase [Allokutzneria albata]